MRQGAGPSRLVTLGVVTVLCAVALTGVARAPQASGDVPATAAVTRVAGPDRIATAAAAAVDAWDRADGAVLARSDDFADALSGGLLAVHLGVPLLLTHPTELSGETAKALGHLGTTRVWVLGGPVAVEESVLTSLSEVGIEPTRVAGRDRYETAARIARQIADGLASPPTLVAALGAHPVASRAWPDAVSAGAFGALSQPHALALTTPDDVPEPSRNLIADLASDQPLSLVGGPEAVSDGVVSTLEQVGTAVVRRWGGDRYATSRAVADQVLAGLDASPRPLVVVTGRAFPDALAAAPFAAFGGTGNGRAAGRPGVLLLVPGDTLTSADGHADWIAANRDRFSQAVIIGGEVAVEPAVASELAGLLSDAALPKAGPAVAWRFEPSGVLLEPGGAAATVDLVGVDAQGTRLPEIPAGTSVRLSDRSVASLSRLDNDTWELKPSDSLGSALLGAEVGGTTVDPASVLVARAHPDAVVLDDADLFVPDLTGVPTSVGPFTAEEFAARAKADNVGILERVPVALRGPALPPGTLLIATGRYSVIGRVVDPPSTPTLTRSAATLLSVETVPAHEAFEDLSIQLGSEDLTAVGVDRQVADVPPARDGTAARTPSAISECSAGGSRQVSSPDITDEVGLDTDFELVVADFSVRRMLLRSTATAAVGFDYTLELAASGTFDCYYGVGVKDFPVLGIISFVAPTAYVAAGLPLSGKITVTGGPDAGVDVHCEAAVSGFVEIAYTDAGGFTTDTDGGVVTEPSCSADLAGVLGQVTVDATVEGGGRIDVGVRPGGVTAAAYEKFKGAPVNRIDLLALEALAETGLRWASTGNVLARQASDAEIPLRARLRVRPVTEKVTHWINTELLGEDSRVKLSLSTDPLVDQPYALPSPFRGLTDFALDVQVDGTQQPTNAAIRVEPGQTVELNAIFDHVSPVGFANDLPTSAELWRQTDDGSWDESDLLVLTTSGMQAVGSTTITEDHCDPAHEDHVAGTYAVVGFNELGPVDTPGWGGAVPLTCGEALTVTPDAVDISGNQTATVTLQPEGLAGWDWIIRDGQQPSGTFVDDQPVAVDIAWDPDMFRDFCITQQDHTPEGDGWREWMIEASPKDAGGLPWLEVPLQVRIFDPDDTRKGCEAAGA